MHRSHKAGESLYCFKCCTAVLLPCLRHGMVGGKAVGVGRASAWFPKLSPRRRVAVAVVVACSLIYIGSVARWERHPKPVKPLALLYKTVGRGVTNNEAVVKGRAAIVTCTKDQ